MTENEIIAALERRIEKSHDQLDTYAHQYLVDYHREKQKNNQALSFEDLQKMFYKPVFCVVNDGRSYWMIVKELRILSCGHWVVGNDCQEVRFENCNFYKQEV